MISKLLAAALCATCVFVGAVSLVIPFPLGGVSAAAWGWLAVTIFQDLYKSFPK